MTQSTSTALPLVSEFHKVISWPVNKPLPPNSRPLSTPPVGAIASEGFRTIGIHRNPEDFVKDALACKHPSTASDELPPPMLRAIKFTTEHTPEHVGKTRSSVLREMVAKARELTQGEEDLKSSLSARRKEILAPKRMLLFKWLMEKSGSSNTSPFQDTCNGFDLTGTLPESHIFSKKFRPAHLPTETLRGVAKQARFAMLSSVKSSGDHALDLGVYEATLKEQQKGFVVGPIHPDTLPDGATLTRRFGVQQKGKVRPIDDYTGHLWSIRLSRSLKQSPYMG